MTPPFTARPVSKTNGLGFKTEKLDRTRALSTHGAGGRTSSRIAGPSPKVTVREIGALQINYSQTSLLDKHFSGSDECGRHLIPFTELGEGLQAGTWALQGPSPGPFDLGCLAGAGTISFWCGSSCRLRQSDCTGGGLLNSQDSLGQRQNYPQRMPQKDFAALCPPGQKQCHSVF